MRIVSELSCSCAHCYFHLLIHHHPQLDRQWQYSITIRYFLQLHHQRMYAVSRFPDFGCQQQQRQDLHPHWFGRRQWLQCGTLCDQASGKYHLQQSPDNNKYSQ